LFILGISAHYHDSAATLLRDGAIVAAGQEERWTRKKHENAFPVNAIKWCLESQGIELSDVEAVVYYEKPLLKFDRILETYIENAPWGIQHFVRSFPVWIKQKLFLRQVLLRELRKIDSRFPPEKILFSEHHLSHAASAFYPSPYKDALVVTLDGVGEWATSSVSIGRGSDLEMIQETYFPHSIGFLYSALTTFCGFKANSGEYKMMGLAPYGEPRFFNLMLEKLVSLSVDGSFHLNLEYFDFVAGDKMFHRRMENLFGIPARAPEAPLTNDYMDVAASAQKLLEFVLLHVLRCLFRDFPSENLCLAGGVALNCVANSRILKYGPFKNVWIQPAAGDAGGSLGAALAAHHIHLKKTRDLYFPDGMKGSYLGPSSSDSDIESALNETGLVYEKVDDIYKKVALQLSEGLSVGWFQGAMEFGPRSLGARSILADARNPEMQKKLNLQIKFRESFRPFAPMILEEDLTDWFEFDRPSPFMLFVANLVQGKIIADESAENFSGLDRLYRQRSEIPAVTHVDYSARIQTVNAEVNTCIYPLLSEFKKLTGCPVLVNTSFNVRGEPIVGSPKDAIRCFLGTDLDILAIGSYFVEKKKQAEGLRDRSRQYFKNFELD
jgi:carbamoyltransferase